MSPGRRHGFSAGPNLRLTLRNETRKVSASKLICSGDPLGSTIVSWIAPPVRLISSTGVASPIGIVTVPRKTPATPVLVNTNPPRPFEKSTGPRSESTEPTCRFSTAILTTFSAGFDVFAVCSKTKLPETSKVSMCTVIPVPVRRTNLPGSSKPELICAGLSVSFRFPVSETVRLGISSSVRSVDIPSRPEM